MAVGYLNGLLMTVLRAELVAPVTVGVRAPADIVGRLPYLWARSIPGGINRGPYQDTRFEVPIQLDGFDADPRDAHDLTATALAALHEAWWEQTVTDDGHLARLRNVSGPYELRESDQPDSFYRFTATATVALRPPA